MPSYYCECRCGCDAKVDAPFGLCPRCLGGDHKYLNLNLSIRRDCESCSGNQVYDRSSCTFVCEPSCQDFARESTQF